MRAPERRQDEAALERLREHETALSRRLETARADAQEVRARAEQQSAALRAAERSRIEQDVAAEARAAAGALEDELAARREASTRAVQHTREQADRRREEAIARLVEAASGGSP